MNALIWFLSWIITGYVLFLVSVRIDPQAEELIEDNEKVMVALVLLWPFLLYGLLKYFYLQLRGEK